ncbi:MAG: MBL fold metallo-hydrolase [Syntrophobacterales bacterium]|jgi:L-ascorbate metabolism protein UlaG (beta-lactamase superfamily)|nr:MBL fold metallo-hydrolase [Syntrophobacterales bacterium]
MKIKWYGHAAFGITTDQGVKIIIDPYQSGAFGGALTYGKITEEADLVLTSHDHDDHNYVKDIKGTFVRIATPGIHESKGVKIQALPAYHDPSKGSERGSNLLFVIEADGLRVTHFGDLGHVLGNDLIKDLGPIDVLLLPVGGFFTIDSLEATEVMESVKPAITIPMHFKTEKCEFPIAPLDEFTKGKKGVIKVKSSEIEVVKESLPQKPEIFVLQYAL